MKQMKVGIVGTGLIASLMAKTLNGLNDENIKKDIDKIKSQSYNEYMNRYSYERRKR